MNQKKMKFLCPTFLLNQNLFSFLFSFYLKDGQTPLHFAVQNGHEQIVQILIEKGNPNVNLPDKVLIIIMDLLILFLFLWN